MHPHCKKQCISGRSQLLRKKCCPECAPVRKASPATDFVQFSWGQLYSLKRKIKLFWYYLYFRKDGHLYWYNKFKCSNSSKSVCGGVNMLFSDQHAVSDILQCNTPTETLCSRQTCPSWKYVYLQGTKTCWNSNFEDVLSVHCNMTFKYGVRNVFFTGVMKIHPLYPH